MVHTLLLFGNHPCGQPITRKRRRVKLHHAAVTRAAFSLLFCPSVLRFLLSRPHIASFTNTSPFLLFQTPSNVRRRNGVVLLKYLHTYNCCNTATRGTAEAIGVGDGGSEWGVPPKIRGKYFSGNNYVKFGNFSDKNHVKFGNFVNFSGKY